MDAQPFTSSTAGGDDEGPTRGDGAQEEAGASTSGGGYPVPAQQHQLVQLTPTLQATLEQCCQLFEATCCVKVQKYEVVTPTPILNPSSTGTPVKGPASSTSCIEVEVEEASGDSTGSSSSSCSVEEVVKVEKVVSPQSKLSIQCPVCQMTLNSKHFLEDHLKLHSEEQRFKCGNCGVEFWSEDELSQHMGVGWQYKYTCVFCCRGFKKQRDYFVHLRGHTEEKSYICRVKGCEASYRRRSVLKQHQRMVHLKAKLKLKCKWALIQF